MKLVNLRLLLLAAPLLICSCSTEHNIECTGDFSETAKMVGKSIDVIERACGEHSLRDEVKNSGVYAYEYVISSGEVGDKIKVQAFSYKDTVRVASTNYRYWMEELDEGETMEEYKPAVKKYEEMKAHYDSKDSWTKRRLSSKQKSRVDNFLSYDSWFKGKDDSSSRLPGNINVTTSRIIKIKSKDGRGEVKRLDKAWVRVKSVAEEVGFFKYKKIN